MLIDKPLRDVLNAFSAPTPTPGGGSAAALAGAVGASLLIMVAGLPKKSRSDDDRARLAEAAETLEMLRGKLIEFIDLDSAAYDGVLSAYRLPKASPEEQERRQAAIQWSLRQAIDVPLDTMRACRRALSMATDVARLGNRSAASDIEVAIELLTTSLRGGRLNVETNLASLTDQGAAQALRAEVGSLAHGADQDADRARELLHQAS
jgi:formiminotetrahydrofolate cyclodeaminase